MALTHRLQVLLDEERYVRLERLAGAGGVSIGALVREAIDRSFPDVGIDRRWSANALLDAAPMPVDDWAIMKQELIGELNDPSDAVAGS